MDISSAINWAIPILIVLFFFWIFYYSLKKPLDGLFRLIGRGISSLFAKGREASESVTVEDVITYK